jgi:methylenetetrahydrofolate reductase (NADPH)
MLIRDIQAAKRGIAPVLSFEFFPPKSAEGDLKLLNQTLPELMKLKPDFCSVTYGAGGSTREKTLAIADAIQRQHHLPTMSHLTCVNATRQDLAGVLMEAQERGIRNILALRGDPPRSISEFQRTADGFEFARDLVAFVKGLGAFCIGTAGFPEGHIACKEGKYVDWNRLKAKVDAGADFVITQLFFDNRDFFEFRDYASKIGINVPLVPGLLPITSTVQVQRFTSLCGARIPPPMLARLEELKDDSDGVIAFGVEYCTGQCAELLRQGVEGLHFYTLNQAHTATAILRNLNVAPAA